MRLDANPYAESQGLGSPLMRPPYVDGESRPPPPMTAHMPSSTTSPTPTGVVVARACVCLQNGAAVSGTARRDDVPTALRQNPAAKDQSRLAREALMLLCLPAKGKKGGQRSARVTNARAAAPSQLYEIVESRADCYLHNLELFLAIHAVSDGVHLQCKYYTEGGLNVCNSCNYATAEEGLY